MMRERVAPTADRRLSSRSRRTPAHQQEAGEIDAADGEDAEDGKGEGFERAGGFAEEDLRNGKDFNPLIRFVGERTSDVGKDVAEIGLGLLGRDTGFQESDGWKPMVAASVNLFGAKLERAVEGVDGVQWETEPCRHDADDGYHAAIQFDRRADDVRTASKVLLPELVAQDGNVVSSGLVFSWSEGAAQDGSNAEDAKEIIGTANSTHGRRPLWAFEIGGGSAVAG